MDSIDTIWSDGSCVRQYKQEEFQHAGLNDAQLKTCELFPDFLH